MRHQCHVLKHHANLLGADAAQFAFTEGRDIVPQNFDTARRGFDQAVDMAHQCGFAGP